MNIAKHCTDQPVPPATLYGFTTARLMVIWSICWAGIDADVPRVADERCSDRAELGWLRLR